MSPDLRAGIDLRRAIDRAVDGAHLTGREIEALLAVDDVGSAALLFEAARTLRERHFGRRIFLYGFVYFSTYCRNRCTFCFYRRGNALSPRYRKSADEVVAIARGLADSGVHVVDLTMGEDPEMHEDGRYEPLMHLVRRVRREARRPVMVSPGVVPRGVLAGLCEAGADWYACYQETHDPILYRQLRPGQDYERREASRSEAIAVGLHAEDGILLGVGETVSQRAHSLLIMRAQGVRQVRVMGFVPQRGTPLSHKEIPSLLVEMVTLATMRLVMPDRLIPASLDIDGLRGLEARLMAGANVVTSIIPPDSGLAGVSQATLDIDPGFRTVAGVKQRVCPVGIWRLPLRPSTRAWLAGARPAERRARTAP